MNLSFHIPGLSKEAREDFSALKDLLAGSMMLDKDGSIHFRSADSCAVPPAFSISMKLAPHEEKASLRMDENGGALNGFLQDSPDAGKRLLVTFKDAAKRLQGHVQSIDHIGVNVPRALPNTSWQKITNELSQTGCLYEYPDGIDGYKSDQNLWLFLVQQSYPKFEIVHDGLDDHSVVQIDLKTDLEPEEAANLFPEGFQVEGLENFFWSMPVVTHWPNMRVVRLDLRYKNDGSPTDQERQCWESGDFLKQTCPIVGPSRIPAFRL